MNSTKLWYPLPMVESDPVEFSALYASFNASIAELNCGDRCAPYNERGVPFCCDIRHAVPSAYDSEWEFLKSNTDLWHLFQTDNTDDFIELASQTPQGHQLIACLGHQYCQREYRSVTCRAFPFFPYITPEGDFVGLSYYWEYEDRCWVINNLQGVTSNYRGEFIAAYDFLFDKLPRELSNYMQHSKIMRQIFARRQRAIPLLHRNGFSYKITPSNGRVRRVPAENFPKFGVFKIAAKMPFPDEVSE